MAQKKMAHPPWIMIINWAYVQDRVKRVMRVRPDKESIEAAIEAIKKDYKEEQLLTKEAQEIENLIITYLIKILRKKKRKEITKRKEDKHKSKRRKIEAKTIPGRGEIGIKIIGPFPLGDDPENVDLDGDIEDFLEDLSKQILDQLFGGKRKKKDDDDDDINNSYYL